jgi:hypothetical protein
MLLQVTYKIYTKIITNHLSTVASEYILADCQLGFCPSMSAQLVLRAVMDILEDSKMCNNELHLLYVDCKKAFDSITHSTIFEALNYYGVGPDFVHLIQQLYKGGVADVFVNGEAGTSFPVLQGVWQGDTLSPLLFIITINPSLMWISSAASGYQFTKGLQVSIVTYCNNLALLASSATDMEASF